MAANLGILGSASRSRSGKLDASTVADLSTPVTTIEPIVVTVDEIVEVPGRRPSPVAPSAPVGRPAAPTMAAAAPVRPVSGTTPAPAAPRPPSLAPSRSGSGSIDDHVVTTTTQRVTEDDDDEARG